MCTKHYLLHSHSNNSFPASEAISLHCCYKITGSLSKSFYFSFSRRTSGMMAHCTSPRWPQPTWATTPVMLMAMRNSFRPTLSKWMVSYLYCIILPPPRIFCTGPTTALGARLSTRSLFFFFTSFSLSCVCVTGIYTVAPAIASLHWPSVECSIQFKVLLFGFNSVAPSYLSELWSTHAPVRPIAQLVLSSPRTNRKTFYRLHLWFEQSFKLYIINYTQCKYSTSTIS